MSDNSDQAPKKPYYGGTITVQGRDLITGLVAGETIEFTRILVGSGEVPEGVEPLDMTALAEPVAEATSTVPTLKNNVVSLVVEYRNDMNGGLKKGFWLREFGIFARTREREETLLYYATLGDSPQPVSPFDGSRVDIRRYPVTIAVALDAKVEVTYNPGSFLTAAEARELINELVRQRLDAQATMKLPLTIPASAWEQDPGGLTFRARVPHEKVRDDHTALVILDRAGLETAAECGLDSCMETTDGALLFWAKTAPASDIEIQAILFGPGGGGGALPALPIATATSVGGIKGSDSIAIDPDGTAHALLSGDIFASEDEFNEVVNDVFGDQP